MHRAADALAENDLDSAERGYRAALQHDPALEPAWFDLGLVYKFRHDWRNSLVCSLRAADLNPATEQPAWWNAGIAATALREWPTALNAWRSYGIDLPDVPAPFEYDLGIAPVRVNPVEAPEVVWGRRLDPARIRILNVPLPDCGRRWKDVVLHDGAPNGTREHNGRMFSVFDELEVWESSGVPTLEVDVAIASDDELVRLTESFSDRDWAVEDWTSSIQLLCQACSEGTPHGHDDRQIAAGLQRRLGIAAPLGIARDLLDQWAQADLERRTFSDLHVVSE